MATSAAPVQLLSLIMPPDVSLRLSHETCVVPKHTFKRQNSMVKICQLLIGGPWRRGPLPWYNRHNPALSAPVLLQIDLAILSFYGVEEKEVGKG